MLDVERIGASLWKLLTSNALNFLRCQMASTEVVGSLTERELYRTLWKFDRLEESRNYNLCFFPLVVWAGASTSFHSQFANIYLRTASENNRIVEILEEKSTNKLKTFISAIGFQALISGRGLGTVSKKILIPSWLFCYKSTRLIKKSLHIGIQAKYNFFLSNS